MAIFTATQFDCNDPWSDTTDKGEWMSELCALVYRVNKDRDASISVYVNGELIPSDVSALSDGGLDYFIRYVAEDSFPEVKAAVVTPYDTYELIFSEKNIKESQVVMINGYYNPPDQLIEDARRLGDWVGHVTNQTFTVDFRFHPLLAEFLEITFAGWDRKSLEGDDVQKEAESEKAKRIEQRHRDLLLVNKMGELAEEEICPREVAIRKVYLSFITLEIQAGGRCLAVTEKGDFLTLRTSPFYLSNLHNLGLNEPIVFHGLTAKPVKTEIRIVLRPELELCLEQIDDMFLKNLVDKIKEKPDDLKHH